jgi:hypothetical protein
MTESSAVPTTQKVLIDISPITCHPLMLQYITKLRNQDYEIQLNRGAALKHWEMCLSQLNMTDGDRNILTNFKTVIESIESQMVQMSYPACLNKTTYTPDYITKLLPWFDLYSLAASVLYRYMFILTTKKFVADETPLIEKIESLSDWAFDTMVYAMTLSESATRVNTENTSHSRQVAGDGGVTAPKRVSDILRQNLFASPVGKKSSNISMAANWRNLKANMRTQITKTFTSTPLPSTSPPDEVVVGPNAEKIINMLISAPVLNDTNTSILYACKRIESQEE